MTMVADLPDMTWPARPTQRQMTLTCAACDRPVGAARTLGVVRGVSGTNILAWMCIPPCAPVSQIERVR
jgi:hypothetical protein